MKKEGTIAEMKFITRALQEGFGVAMTVGDSLPYDVIIESNGHLYKIQIKSTNKLQTADRGNSYKINLSKGNKVKTRYKPSEVDFFACYAAPEEAWYILPIDVVEAITIRIYPHREGVGMYEEYKEAWSLIKKKSQKSIT